MGAIEPDLPLECPRCARPHGLEDRFCVDCGMPLVYAAHAVQERPLTEQQQRLRKIKRQYAEGELVRVAGGRNQAEAEFIAGLLLEEGVPSLVRRSIAFDVPDFLAAGPRDVLVPQSGAEAAREILLQADLLTPGDGRELVAPRKLALGLLAGLAVVGAIILIASVAQSDAQPTERRDRGPAVPSLSAN